MPSVRRQFVSSRRPHLVADASLAGGFLVGGLITAGLGVLAGGLVAWLPLGVRMAAAIAVLLVLALQELGVWPFQLPQRSKLIPSERLDLPFPWSGFTFAIELGVGWRTVVPTSLPYGLLAMVILYPTWPVALVAGTCWAAGRWIPVSLTMRSRSRTARSPWPIMNGRRMAVTGLAVLVIAAVTA